MSDRDADEILELAAQARHDVEPELLERIAGSIKPFMRPVRPLPPTWVLASGLILICAAVAVAGAARAGFYGIEKMSVLERALIFPALGILAWVAATEFRQRNDSRKSASNTPRDPAGSHQPRVVWFVCDAVPRLPD